MSILDSIKEENKIISIVGMAKNAGKTVTLNHIIEEAYYNDVNIGITSTGRDGESEDLVTRTEKPTIYVYEDTLIATAEKTLVLGDAKVEIIDVTDYRTPMGRVVIGKVKNSGYVQIAGPNTVHTIKKVSERMIDLGADITLIDGALNRTSSAAPSISDGTILSTGAVLSRDMNNVIRETLHRVSLFTLPSVKDENIRKLASRIIDNKELAIIDKEFNIKSLNIKTALNSGKVIGENIDEDTKAVVISGSLVKKTISDIIDVTKRYKDVDFIIKDGTRVFIDSKVWLSIIRKGFKLKVLNPINIIAVTINPYSPKGYYFEQREFLNKMKSFLTDVNVYDVVYGGE
ncbi:hypothetical protein [Dethiothermospora halolimnae]|uniref:lysine 5,6-aminomutase reactivase subunit KamB n=1 Tax=Dethiothermospora halolimnae TaxID=3114390 RepID=UPI003CCC3F1F